MRWLSYQNTTFVWSFILCRNNFKQLLHTSTQLLLNRCLTWRSSLYDNIIHQFVRRILGFLDDSSFQSLGAKIPAKFIIFVFNIPGQITLDNYDIPKTIAHGCLTCYTHRYPTDTDIYHADPDNWTNCGFSCLWWMYQFVGRNTQYTGEFIKD